METSRVQLALNVSDIDAATAAEPFAAAGLTHRMTESDRCCHAVQDEVWVDAPDVPLGAWEVYTVLADDPDDGTEVAGSTCCSSTAEGSGPCCAGPNTDSER